MKRTFSLRLLSVFLVLVLVLAMTGCGKKENQEGGSGDGLTLTFQQWWADECPDGFFQELVDGFTEETGIKIELYNAPNAETKTTLMAGAANGTIADIVGLDGGWIYELATNEVITPLDELFETCDVDTSQFSDMWTLDGKSYGTPVVSFAYPLFVNVDILEDCGITEMPETWSEFEECCEIITDKGYNAFAYNFDTSNPAGLNHVFCNLYWESGGQMRGDDGLFYISDNDLFLETADYLKQLNDNGVIYPGYATLKEADMTSLFGSGELAFCTCSISMITTWETDSPNLNFTAIPMPVKDDYTGTRYADYACWGIGISENCEHKEEAMQFINYMFTGEVNSSLAQTKGCFPGSTLADPDYSQSSPTFQKVYEYWQEHTPRAEFNGTKDTSVLRTGILEQLVTYLLGDTTSQEFLDNCQAVCDEVYAE